MYLMDNGKQKDMAYDEKRLVKEAQQGDAESFRQLVDPIRNDLYRLAFAYASDADDAEDILQTAFERIFKKLHTFAGRSSFKTWAYRVTINVAKRFRQSKRSAVSYSEARSASTLKPPDDTVLLDEKKKWVKQAVEDLPQLQRAVVLLRLQELPYAEIASRLHITENNAKSSYSQAVKKMSEAARVEGLM